MKNELTTFDKSFQGKWRNRLPEETQIKWGVEMQHFNQLEKADEKLGLCTVESKQMAMMAVATSGLSINPQLCHMYLIPRFNKKIKAYEAQVYVSYRGMMEAVNRTGQIAWVKAKVVYANEPFELIEGTTTELRHKIIPHKDKRGEKVGAYCVAKTHDGELLIEYMDAEQIARVRNASESKDSEYSPWVKFPEEMWKKAVTRRAWKYWPKSGGIEGLNDVLNQYEGAAFDNASGRSDVDEPEIMLSEAQSLELHALLSDNLPDVDAGKWMKRLAASFGEESVSDIPARRFDEAKDVLNSAITGYKEKQSDEAN